MRNHIHSDSRIMSGQITNFGAFFSFLAYQEFFLCLLRIYNRQNNRSCSRDGTSSHTAISSMMNGSTAIWSKARLVMSHFLLVLPVTGFAPNSSTAIHHRRNGWDSSCCSVCCRSSGVIERTLDKQEKKVPKLIFGAK